MFYVGAERKNPFLRLLPGIPKFLIHKNLVICILSNVGKASYIWWDAYYIKNLKGLIIIFVLAPQLLIQNLVTAKYFSGCTEKYQHRSSGLLTFISRPW